jgi:hypothetical protein
MPTLTPSQALLIGFIVAPGLFILSAYLTRATLRHILGALVGAGLYAALNYVWDRAAAAFGWWTYPAWSASGQFPITGYLLAGIVGGGAFGLVGWRLIRRWRWKGFVGFLFFWAVYAVVHDYGGSLLFASSGLMLFGAGPFPIIANVLWYVTGNALPQVAIWFIGGSSIRGRKS